MAGINNIWRSGPGSTVCLSVRAHDILLRNAGLENLARPSALDNYLYHMGHRRMVYREIRKKELWIQSL